MGKGKATAGCVQGSGSCADCPFSYNNLSSHLCAGTPPGEGGHAGVTIALRSGQQVPQFLFWFTSYNAVYNPLPPATEAPSFECTGLHYT